MLEFQPGARAYLMEIRALSTDGDHNEVFVGMTVKESVWYQNYLEESFNGKTDRSDGSQEKYLALHDRHEEARQAAIAAESHSQKPAN
ncbi:hypothetical protein [Pollutimonas harenae]|uniref:Uncharacterized protein n=1 Tax=Pollutimonas harenae TaxID=657015 RepID=A0A853GY54_9BURK|nr:hypothetical protein [Pollutimonas harenae]NYT85676.1 hypothetical protein [Pollutimonas harenae]TEA70751.1 hypothetical protein ERD84_08760 [Pollutimonas harenae]